MMKRQRDYLRVLGASAVLAAACVGCQSKPDKTTAVDQSADLVEHNRLMVRMAFAENVYNGTASERAVYPKDFHAGTASLNQLGQRRVATLVHICDGASGQVVIIRGDESDQLFANRINAVREELTLAGIDPKQITVGDGQVAGEPVSSGRAILGFNRMMSDYAPKAQSAPTGTVTSMGSDSSNQRQ